MDDARPAVRAVGRGAWRAFRSGSRHGACRTITVEIDGNSARSEFARLIFGLNTPSSRNHREKWHTVLSVSCANPGGVTGTIESAVGVRDPAWKPGQYDPRNGRKVRTDPTSLAGCVLTADTHERLMSITDDVQIVVQPTAIRLEAAGVLRQRNLGKQRYRVFEAADVVDLFTGLERALASPTGDIATAAPTRQVPRRPK